MSESTFPVDPVAAATFDPLEECEVALMAALREVRSTRRRRDNGINHHPTPLDVKGFVSCAHRAVNMFIRA